MKTFPPFSKKGGVELKDLKNWKFKDKGINQVTLDFYKEWKSRYLVSGPNPGEYYVNVADTKDPAWKVKPITVSEAHGYGMLIMATMAAADPEAKMIFDSLNRYFQNHRSDKGSQLMAWTQIKGGKTPPDDGGSATDGDLDIAYALLLADEQWGESCADRYKTEALGLIQDIKKWEMDPKSALPLLGDFVQEGEKKYQGATRSSDWMPDHFRLFAKVTGDSFWMKSVESCIEQLEVVTQKFSPQAGLFPDFLEATPNGLIPARPHFLESKFDGEFNYNACRLPWRIGCDYMISQDPRERAFLEKMNRHFRESSGGTADKTSNGYSLDGKFLKGRGNADLAFVAPMAVAGAAVADLSLWRESPLQWMVELPMSEDSYFGNTIKLLSLIAISDN